MKQKGDEIDAVVGADNKAVSEDGRKPANYDHLVEFGHVTPEDNVPGALRFSSRRGRQADRPGEVCRGNGLRI